MNWYKNSQQFQMPFMENIDQDPQYWDKRPDDQRSAPSLDEQSIQEYDMKELIEETDSEQELVNILKAFNVNFEKIVFPNNDFIYTYTDGQKLYVIDGLNWIYDAEEWVYDKITSLNIYDYIEAKDFSKEFWESVDRGYYLYHATTEENWENIKEEGLGVRSETRGISNRGMGAAIFTHPDPEALDSYGNYVIQIDVGAMKRDGYTPTVSLEEPFEDKQQAEALAYTIGLKDFYYEVDQDLWEDTIAFYGNIPPKYLSLIK